MQPSSLVFLVIIAIWAAYFVQHWVRRREHLATARSVDRFSESMRVLEHRAALPVADLSAPQPRSYAVSPARPARAEVVVKRAGRAPEAVGAPSAATAGAVASDPMTRDASAQRSSVAPSRRARGLTLLGSLVSVPLFVVLAAVGVLPWLAVLAPVVAVGGALAWVRSGVRAEQAARHAARAARSGRGDASAGARPASSARPTRAQGHPATPARASRTQAPGRSASVSSSAPQRADDGKVDPEPVAAPPRVAEPGVAQRLVSEPAAVRDSFYDVEAVERASAPARSVPASPAVPALQQVPVLQVPVGPLVDEDDIPLTWDPVPVPRPTYTMKAVAPRTQMPPVEQGVPPEFADAAYDEPVRRVAGA